MNQATQDFIRHHQDDDVRKLAFLGSKNPEVNMPFALDQIRGRQMARIKLPRWASIDGIIYPPHISMEQCSSEQTALYKAELAARLLGNSSLSSLRGEIVPQGDNSKICEFATKSTVDSEFAQNEGTCEKQQILTKWVVVLTKRKAMFAQEILLQKLSLLTLLEVLESTSLIWQPDWALSRCM